MKDDNYIKVWKERILLHLRWIDINYAIRKGKLPIDDTGIKVDISLHDKWKQSSHLRVIFMKTKISIGINGLVDQYNDVPALLKAIDKQLVTLDKALANTLILKFSFIKLTSVKGVCEHIIQMRDIVALLKILEVDISKSFIVHYILNTFPQQYGPFKISYNMHKDKWLINELMTIYVQEEGRLVVEGGEGVYKVTQGKNMAQAKKKGKDKYLSKKK